MNENIYNGPVVTEVESSLSLVNSITNIHGGIPRGCSPMLFDGLLDIGYIFVRGVGGVGGVGSSFTSSDFAFSLYLVVLRTLVTRVATEYSSQIILVTSLSLFG